VRTYDLVAAYEDNLHVRFANANSDQELMDFIRAWGPLYIPHGQPSGIVTIPFADCRTSQRRMKALMGALTAFKWAKGEREALAELIHAGNYAAESASINFATGLQITGDVLEWAKSASLHDVRTLTCHLIDAIVCAQFPLRFISQRKGNRRQMVAGWRFFSLEEALRWMVWYDEFTKHPIICCAECRTVFRGETVRLRKYCSVECGHRATARAAMRKRRDEERAERI
jgi:hypothetical protein